MLAVSSSRLCCFCFGFGYNLMQKLTSMPDSIRNPITARTHYFLEIRGALGRGSDHAMHSSIPLRIPYSPKVPSRIISQCFPSPMQTPRPLAPQEPGTSSFLPESISGPAIFLRPHLDVPPKPDSPFWKGEWRRQVSLLLQEKWEE